MNIFNYLPVDYSIRKNFIFFCLCVLFLCLQISAAPAGRLDIKFPQILANGANVTAIETQPDGKILLAGKFTTRGAIVRHDVIRLNADGTLDSTFDIGGETPAYNLIRFIKLQADGKILIAGYISQIGSTYVHPLVRLDQNGSIDRTFNLSGIDVTFVRDLDVQSDGKILISASNLIGSSFITRLKTDGSNDQGIGQPLFTDGNGGYNYKITYLPAENKFLVGGKFIYSANQTQYNNLAKINLNGTIDSTFAVNVSANQSFEVSVNTKLLAGGKILVFGHFDTVNGITRRNIAVLNSDGGLESSFNPATTGAEYIYTVAEQSNGKILIGGNLFPLNSPLHGNIARLNADGTVDRTFFQGRGANSDVNALKIVGGNKILLGGKFFRYHVFPRSGLAQVIL